MTVIAIFDSSVLHPTPLAETLLRIAEVPDLFRIHFSKEILEDISRNIVSQDGKSKAVAGRFIDMLAKTYPGALKEVDSRAHTSMPNHPRGRHILAAALARPHCDSIITFNTDYFSSEDVERFGVVAVDPDTFLCDLSDEISDRKMLKILREQSKGLSSSRISTIALLDKLHKRKVPKFANRMAASGFSDDIVRVAKRTLHHMGTGDPETERRYAGSTYVLKSSSDTLQVKRIESEITILEKSSEEKYVDITPKDVMNFLDYNKTLSEYLRLKRDLEKREAAVVSTK